MVRGSGQVGQLPRPTPHRIGGPGLLFFDPGGTGEGFFPATEGKTRGRGARREQKKREKPRRTREKTSASCGHPRDVGRGKGPGFFRGGARVGAGRPLAKQNPPRRRTAKGFPCVRAGGEGWGLFGGPSVRSHGGKPTFTASAPGSHRGPEGGATRLAIGSTAPGHHRDGGLREKAFHCARRSEGDVALLAG